MSQIARIETIEPSNALTPMDMIDRAVSSGASVETLAKLMDLQERWEKNHARKAFDAAVADAKAKIKPIVRTSTGHNSKKYADFASIARSVDPIISEYGLSYRFRSHQDDRINVTCVLSHKLGHCEETTLSGPPDNSGSKNAIQAIGSTLTYLQRYSLMQALGLAAGNDDDGRGSEPANLITQEQTDSIRDALEANGKTAASFLKWAKVDRIEDLRADYYDSAIAAIKAK